MPKRIDTEVDFASRDIYREYKKEVEKGGIYDIKRAQFIRICFEFNKKIVSRTLHDGFMCKMPAGFGNLRIDKYKMELDRPITKFPIDWKRTKEYGKIVRLFNEHTNGNVYKFKWDRPQHRFLRRYKLIMVREYKREMARQIFAREIKY